MPCLWTNRRLSAYTAAVAAAPALPSAHSPVDLDGPAYPTILKLAIPTVIAMMSQAIVNAVDAVFFAHLPTHEEANAAQAALMPSLILLWMFGGSLSAIGVGTQALVARRFVERRPEAAGSVLTNGSAFIIAGGALLTVVSLYLLPWMAQKQHPNADVQTVIVDYGTYRMWGIVSMALTMGLKGFFDGLGRTWIHFVSSVVMNIFNILFCYIFIFGKFGAPVMGAAGAGLAALLATWIGLFTMVIYLWLDRTTFRPFRISNLSMPLIWDILKLSVPAAVATVIMMFGFQVFVRIVAMLDEAAGVDAAVDLGAGVKTSINGAATSNIISMLKLTFTACLAFGTATATLVAQSIGAGRPDRAVFFGWASLRLGLMVFGVVGALEGTFAQELTNLWTTDPEVREAMLTPMRLMGWTTPAIAVCMIMTEALFGAGTPKFVAVAQFLMVFGVLLPCAYLFAITLGWGLNGIWIAATTYMVVGSVVMSAKFVKGSWQSVRI